MGLRLAALRVSAPVLVADEAAATVPDRWAPRLGDKPRRVTLKVSEPPPQQRAQGSRSGKAPAETGRPETAKEFSQRIKRVVLRGPRTPRKEGAGEPQNPDLNTQLEPEQTEEVSLPLLDEGDSVPFEPTMGNTQTESPAQLGPEGVPNLVEHLAERPDGIDLKEAVKGRYGEDSFFKDILANPKHFKNFRIIDGVILVKEKELERLCIPNVQKNQRSVREIVITHAHSLLAHLGSTKTLSFLRDHVWWKSMVKDVQKYCDSCMTCKRSKPNNQKPYGLLNTLAVPGTPWEAIGINFVGPMPESSNRDAAFDAITVIICLLTGMVHLVPSRTNYTAKQVAELVFSEVYKLHGIPRSIVSDRDVLFTSLFWTHLHKLIGSELRMSSAYHPESDGSTERANRTVTQMLRQCVSPDQRDWVTRLPAIEFAINSARSESTGYAPFFLNSGRMPRAMIWENPSEKEFPSVRVFAQKVKYAIMAAHDSILAARVKQVRDANRRRRPSPFEKGDLVYISTKNMSLPKGLARKLTPKFVGPYLIREDFGNNSYRIDLPSETKRRGVHDVFHSSLLRPHEPNDDRLFPGRLISQVANLDDQEGEWAIEKILSHKGAREGADFEVLWKSGDKTWVPYLTLARQGPLSSYLELLGVRDISDLRENATDPDEGDLPLGLGLMIWEGLGDRESNKSGTPGGLEDQNFGLGNLPSPHCPTNLFPTLNQHGPVLVIIIIPYPFQTFPFLYSIPIMLIHAYLSRAVDEILLKDPMGQHYFFHGKQVKAYLDFDHTLRNLALRGSALPPMGIPGGYDHFQGLWALDGSCQYQFCEYDPKTRTGRPRGEQVPDGLLLPRTEAPQSPRTPAAGADGNNPQLYTRLLQSVARRTLDIEDKVEKRRALKNTGGFGEGMGGSYGSYPRDPFPGRGRAGRGRIRRDMGRGGRRDGRLERAFSREDDYGRPLSFTNPTSPYDTSGFDLSTTSLSSLDLFSEPSSPYALGFGPMHIDADIPGHVNAGFDKDATAPKDDFIDPPPTPPRISVDSPVPKEGNASVPEATSTPINQPRGFTSSNIPVINELMSGTTSGRAANGEAGLTAQSAGSAHLELPGTSSSTTALPGRAGLAIIHNDEAPKPSASTSGIERTTRLTFRKSKKAD